MGVSLVVLPAPANRVSELYEVQVESIRGLCSDDYSPEQIESWIESLDPDMYRSAIEHGNESLFMATVDGEAAGFSAIKESDLQAIYVRPDHSRRGIGSLLLYSSEYQVRVRKLRRVRVLSSLTAGPFFEYHGYKVTKETPRILENGVQLDFLTMERSLPQ